MSTYKLIQDIEAEDHILGPLTLRQFIFGLVAVFFGYLCFIVVTRHVLFLLAFFLPPALFCAFFAVPFGKDQPTEIWFLAKLRFWFLPRRRIWNQSGVKELVTITAPKKVEKILTNGLSQGEVKSRLQALANTLDSRGWAVKGVDVFATPAMATVGGPGDASDRLISFSSMSQPAPSDDASADDVLDEETSPVAQQMQSMIQKSKQDYHKKLEDEMAAAELPQPAQQGSGQWFMNKGANSPSATELPQMALPPQPAAIPTDTAAPQDEAALAEQIEEQTVSKDEALERMHTVQPVSNQPAADSTPPANDPALLSLASNDDLNISTIAHEAKRATDEDENPDEVVIKLH